MATVDARRRWIPIRVRDCGLKPTLSGSPAGQPGWGRDFMLPPAARVWKRQTTFLNSSRRYDKLKLIGHQTDLLPAKAPSLTLFKPDCYITRSFCHLDLFQVFAKESA